MSHSTTEASGPRTGIHVLLILALAGLAMAACGGEEGETGSTPATGEAEIPSALVGIELGTPLYEFKLQHGAGFTCQSGVNSPIRYEMTGCANDRRFTDNAYLDNVVAFTHRGRVVRIEADLGYRLRGTPDAMDADRYISAFGAPPDSVDRDSTRATLYWYASDGSQFIYTCGTRSGFEECSLALDEWSPRQQERARDSLQAILDARVDSARTGGAPTLLRYEIRRLLADERLAGGRYRFTDLVLGAGHTFGWTWLNEIRGLQFSDVAVLLHCPDVDPDRNTRLPRVTGTVYTAEDAEAVIEGFAAPDPTRDDEVDLLVVAAESCTTGPAEGESR